MDGLLRHIGSKLGVPVMEDQHSRQATTLLLHGVVVEAVANRDALLDFDHAVLDPGE